MCTYRIEGQGASYTDRAPRNYFNSGDLRFQLVRRGHFSHGRSRFCAAEVVEGIEVLHAAGVTHHILIDNDVYLVRCGSGKSKELRRGMAQQIPSANLANSRRWAILDEWQ